MFENLDDPRKQALLALAAGLLSPVRGKGWSGFGEAASQGINAGLLGFNQAQRTQEVVKRGEMERQLEQARLAQMKQAQDAQAYMGKGIGKFMSPGSAGVPYNDALGDGQQGFVQPPQAPSFDKQGFAQYLAQNPATAREALNFLPQPKAPISVKKDEVLLDPTTNKPIFKNTTADKPPELVRYQMLADDPNQPESVRAMARAYISKATTHAPPVSVSLDARQETEFSKEIGKLNAKDYGDLMKSGAMAQSKVTKLDRLSNLLSKSGATGKLTPATVELKAAAESLGFKVDDKLPFQQAAQALSNEIALELRNPSGGAGMPGALSDRDREFLVSMVPNLGKTAEGNKLLIETMKRLAQREAQVSKMARDYKIKTGKFDEGFYQELANFSDANPLFSQPSKSSPQAPKPGTVDGGYVFMGGDPGDPKNWKKR